MTQILHRVQLYLLTQVVLRTYHFLVVRDRVALRVARLDVINDREVSLQYCEGPRGKTLVLSMGTSMQPRGGPVSCCDGSVGSVMTGHNVPIS